MRRFIRGYLITLGRYGAKDVVSLTRGDCDKGMDGDSHHQDCTATATALTFCLPCQGTDRLSKLDLQALHPIASIITYCSTRSQLKRPPPPASQVFHIEDPTDETDRVIWAPSN